MKREIQMKRERKVPGEIATGGDCWRERSAAEKCHNCSKTKQVFSEKDKRAAGVLQIFHAGNAG